MGMKVHYGAPGVQIVRGKGSTSRSSAFVPAPIVYSGEVVKPSGPVILRGSPPISFAMVGAQKCGTTTCYYEFNRHPDVFMDNAERFVGPIPPPNLSIHLADLKRRSKGKTIAGLMYTHYAMTRTAPALAQIFGPHLKILMLVRDPVRRAVSNYWMEYNRGNEDRGIEALWQDGPLFYHRQGFYAEHLRDLVKTFPQEQLLIVRTEDLNVDTPTWLGRMLAFIGAEPLPGPFPRHRVGSYSYALPPELEAFLYDLYAESNRQLHEDFGVRVDDWVRP